jgi:NAD(P) transhydrogenase subunit alpha
VSSPIIHAPLATLPGLLADAVAVDDPAARFIRLLTVFLLAMWVGFEVITKVPQRLHTPLTSGSNAISGITAVGAIIAAGAVATGFRFGNLLGLVAVIFAMINVAGGFVVTHRMLQMFHPSKKK